MTNAQFLSESEELLKRLPPYLQDLIPRVAPEEVDARQTQDDLAAFWKAADIRPIRQSRNVQSLAKQTRAENPTDLRMIYLRAVAGGMETGSRRTRGVFDKETCLFGSLAINRALLFSDPVSYTHLTLPTILRV